MSVFLFIASIFVCALALFTGVYALSTINFNIECQIKYELAEIKNMSLSLNTEGTGVIVKQINYSSNVVIPKYTIYNSGKFYTIPDGVEPTTSESSNIYKIVGIGDKETESPLFTNASYIKEIKNIEKYNFKIKNLNNKEKERNIVIIR